MKKDIDTEKNTDTEKLSDAENDTDTGIENNAENNADVENEADSKTDNSGAENGAYSKADNSGAENGAYSKSDDTDAENKADSKADDADAENGADSETYADDETDDDFEDYDDTEDDDYTEDDAAREKTKNPGKWLPLTVSAVFAVLICGLIAALALTGNLGSLRHNGAEVTERPFYTEEPASAKPTAKPEETKEPPFETEEPKPEGYEKTTVFVDGTPEATLASRQAAEEMVKNAVNHFENMCMAEGLITNVKNEIEFRKASELSEVTSYDQAYNDFISKDSPLIVESKTSLVTFKIIAHKTETVESEQYYTGMRLVEIYGRDGKSRSVSEYTYINGVQTENAVLEEKVLYPPVDEVIIIGIREIPEGETPDPEFGKEDCPPTELQFDFPVEAEIIKFFGFYNSVMFNGIDFDTAEGTECKVSCEGTVISVMERGSRGFVVDVLHENGFITRYAGLQSVNKNIGDTAAAGEILGIVGKTGLHFEILYESRPRNPRIYLLRLFEET